MATSALFQVLFLLALALISKSHHGVAQATSTYSIASVEAQPVEESTGLDNRALPDFSLDDEDVHASTWRNETSLDANHWLLELVYNGYQGPTKEIELDFYVLDYQTCRIEIPDSPIAPRHISIQKESLVALFDMDVEAAAQRPDLVFYPEPETIAASATVSVSRSDPTPVLGFCAYVTIHYQGIFVKFMHTKLHMDLETDATVDLSGGGGSEPTPGSPHVAGNTGYEDLRDSPPEMPSPELFTLSPNSSANSHMEDMEEDPERTSEVDIPPEEFGLVLDSDSSNEPMLPILLSVLGVLLVLLVALCLLMGELKRRNTERKAMLTDFLDLEQSNKSKPTSSQPNTKQEGMIGQFFEGSSVHPDHLPAVLDRKPQEVTGDAVSVDVSAVTMAASMATGKSSVTGRRWAQTHDMRRTTEDSKLLRSEDRGGGSRRSLGSSKRSHGPVQIVENDSGFFLGTDVVSVASHASRRSFSASRRSFRSEYSV